MTVSRDPDRLIREFLAEGQTELADPVYDAVRATIDQRRQRAVIGPWRMPAMNKLVPIAVGAAAVVVAIVAGGRLLGAPAGQVGGAPSIEPSAAAQTALPSPAGSAAAAPSSAPEGLLPEGSHVLWDEDGVRMTVTLPAGGWYGSPAGGILAKDDNVDAPGGAGMIVFAGNPGYLVYGDPCRWSTTTPETAAATVDELVAALGAQASRDASTPVDIAVDGRAGKSITLHVPADAAFAQCDEGKFASWGVKETTLRHQQDPGQIDKLWIVDVDGRPVIIDIGYYDGTPQAVVDELEAIVASLTFR
jgi:hypothetical protein